MQEILIDNQNLFFTSLYKTVVNKKEFKMKGFYMIQDLFEKPSAILTIHLTLSLNLQLLPSIPIM